MLRRDFARTTDSIGATDFYKMATDFHDRQKQKELDANEIMSGYQKGVNMQRQNALADALQSGDEEAINKAAAAYNPQGQLDYIQRIKQARADADLAFQRQKEMADYNHALDMKKQDALYNLKNNLEAIKGGYGTAAQQNVSFLTNQGYTPEQAVALAFSGQNPAFSQMYPSLGKEGAKKSDQELGKNYAADLDEYNNMVSKMPELESTIGRLKELAPKATYTKIGNLRNLLKKEIQGRSTEGGVAREEYDSIISNQVLPLMRDTFGAQFTQKEGETLRATLGDVNKTPEEKEAALRSFIEQKKKSIESKYRKLQSYEQGMGAKAYAPTDEDAWGGI